MPQIDNNVDNQAAANWAPSDSNLAPGGRNVGGDALDAIRLCSLADLRQSFSSMQLESGGTGSVGNGSLDSLLPKLSISKGDNDFAGPQREGQENTWTRHRDGRDRTDEDAARAAEIIGRTGDFGDRKEQKEIDEMYKRAAKEGPEAVDRLTKAINEKLEKAGSPYRLDTEYSTQLNWHRHHRFGAVNVRSHELVARVRDVGVCRVGEAPGFRSTWNT